MKISLPISFAILLTCNVCYGQGFFFGDNTTAAEFSAMPKAAQPATRDLMDIPASFSLKKFAPPVGSQGNYGTCTAWSSAYAARTISYTAQRGITNKDSIAKYTFSPGFVYKHIKNSNDLYCSNGSSISSAMNIMKQKGVMLAKDGLFDCSALVPDPAQEAVSAFRIKDFITLSNYGTIGKNEILKIKKSLSENKPVVISLKCYESFEKVVKDGIWTPTFSDAFRGNHAMCIVGYDDSVNGGSFEVMNSWGTFWGNAGFFWLKYDQFIQNGNYAVELMDQEFEKPRAAEKPKLAGNIDFVLLDSTAMPVVRKKMDMRSIVVEDDAQAEYSQYKMKTAYPNGTSFKIKFTTNAPAYVYIFSEDTKKVVSRIFPYNPLISAAINSNNTTVFFPAEDKHARLSADSGRENICVLYSKESLDFNALVDYINTNRKSIYEGVKDQYKNRLVEMSKVQFSNESIKFTAPAEEKSIVCFFVELEHN